MKTRQVPLIQPLLKTERLDSLRLHNKIFLSFLAVILFISLAIALLSRWILVSSLNTELEQRGIAVARSIAERANGLILDKDNTALVSLLFETVRIGERKNLIAYIFVMDTQDTILAHTFTRPFPESLRSVGPPDPAREYSVNLVDVKNGSAYDIAVPITEGLYRIGAVHVGLSKNHIDQLIGKLRTTFLGFIAAIFVFIFFISHRLSRGITLPLSRLTKVSDEVSRGNFDIKFDPSGRGEDWHPEQCPAYTNTDLPCWHLDQSIQSGKPGSSPESLHSCRNCVFYKKRDGDEVVQLADSFNNMVWSIKLYRKQIRESEEKYRSLFYSGPDPIFVIDYDSQEILDANPRSEEMYGYRKEELIGMDFAELDPDYPALHRSLFEEPDGDTACVQGPKTLHFKKGRRPFYVNVHACPISYKSRQAIILAATDITGMIEKDAQLIQASKMKTLGEMSAGMAHELNQPLNAIRMGSEFLEMMVQRGTIEHDHLLQVVREISIQVDRSAEIINTLREFSRKGDMHKEKLDINTSIRGVLRLVDRQLTLQNIDVLLDLDESIRPIMAQNNRFQQVLFNLLLNARDAIVMKEDSGPDDGGQHISIRTYGRNGLVAVAVSDTGMGIPAPDRDKIFEPFYTTKQTGQGMGLGLSISYGIVKDFGGQIVILASSGEGTTFELSFPAAN